MRTRPTLFVLVLALLPVIAHAATTCTVSATTVAFGTVQFTTVNSTGTVTINCNANDASIAVALSTGGNGSYSPRKMSSGTNKLQYNLYKDSAHTQIWGNGTSGTVTNTGSAVASVALKFTVYGQVPAQALPAPGSYTDSITVTLTY